MVHKNASLFHLSHHKLNEFAELDQELELKKNKDHVFNLETEIV